MNGNGPNLFLCHFQASATYMQSYFMLKNSIFASKIVKKNLGPEFRSRKMSPLNHL